MTVRTIEELPGADPLIIAEREFASRLIVGTGKYRSHEQTVEAVRASGAEMVTGCPFAVPGARRRRRFRRRARWGEMVVGSGQVVVSSPASSGTRSPGS